MKIQWKCSMCGYQFEGGTSPPDRCPSCKEACAFIDATCYIPECEGPEGRDRRI
ncbi:MAG: hypothetical protein O8C64_01690 [Candidatus Methanoperedens sp.]|nr:hypothetical protein [Candidatus Methanoperedens sp.]MCZ7405257.1 hypothetical protein [Candidatus Methanoperedens sp.]